MTDQIYDRQETDTALEALRHLSIELPEPFVLIGGWAVYLTVNESYSQEHGVPYLGSRDIDLGFHINPNWDEKAVEESNFARALKVLKENGYAPHGSFRYCKMMKRETGAALTEEQAKREPSHEIINLFVDMMVDNIHPKHKQIFKVDPLDEPLVARVFDGNCGVVLNLQDFQAMIPPPQLLLAMKLKSIVDRQPGDKLLKDACDIYAIMWHSPAKIGELVQRVHEEHHDLCKGALGVITEEVAIIASSHLGIDVERYLGVVRQLA